MAEKLTFDPTFAMQRDAPAPVTRAIVLGSAGDNVYRVRFEGQEISCRSAGNNAIANGTAVSIIDMQPHPWIVAASAGYESRISRQLAPFFKTKPASALLLYWMRNNPRDYLYRPGVCLGHPALYTMRVSCWDGVTRDMGVEYAGAQVASSGIPAGDPVICWQKEPNRWVVLGRSAPDFQFWVLIYNTWRDVDGDATSRKYEYTLGGKNCTTWTTTRPYYATSGGLFVDPYPHYTPTSSEDEWASGNFQWIDAVNGNVPAYDSDWASRMMLSGAELNIGTYSALIEVPAGGTAFSASNAVLAQYRGVAAAGTGYRVAGTITIVYTAGADYTWAFDWALPDGVAGSVLSSSDVTIEYDYDLNSYTVCTCTNENRQFRPIAPSAAHSGSNRIVSVAIDATLTAS